MKSPPEAAAFVALNAFNLSRAPWRQDRTGHECAGSNWMLAGLQHVTTQVTLILVAIKSFRHKGLERFFATGNRRGIQAKHADRLRLILGRLNAAADPRDLSLPGLDLHELQGARKETWAVRVSGNSRVTFSFVDKEAEHVDYEDDH